MSHVIKTALLTLLTLMYCHPIVYGVHEDATMEENVKQLRWDPTSYGVILFACVLTVVVIKPVILKLTFLTCKLD